MFVRICRFLFFSFIVRPVLFLLLGVHIRGRELLPSDGPAILIANHNSHLDTVMLMMAVPGSAFNKLRPVAAADYWLKNGFLRWFSRNIIRIIPIHRSKEERQGDPLDGISEALDNGEIVIFFPEGSRGEPEVLQEFKFGIAKLAERHPKVPVVPIFMRGLGRALPKDEGLLVPFMCEVYVGPSLRWTGDGEHFMERLRDRIEQLSRQGFQPTWE